MYSLLYAEIEILNSNIVSLKDLLAEALLDKDELQEELEAITDNRDRWYAAYNRLKAKGLTT